MSEDFENKPLFGVSKDILGTSTEDIKKIQASSLPEAGATEQERSAYSLLADAPSGAEELLDFIEYLLIRLAPDQTEVLAKGEELLKKYNRE